MAFPIVGRLAVLKKGVTTIAGVKTKSMSIANEPVDITSDDDAGFRALLAAAGTRALDFSVEGTAKDTTLLTTAIGADAGLLTGYSLFFPTVGTVAGDFFLTSFELSGETAAAVTFSASLVSSGAYTFVPVV